MRPTAQAGVERAGEALRLTGALDLSTAPALWKRLPALEGVRRLDLTAATTIDSVGLALLAEIAARADGSIQLDGQPPGLKALAAAYRLGPDLAPRTT